MLIALAIFASASVVLVSAFTQALLAREKSIGNDLYHMDIQAARMQLLLEPSLESAEDGSEYPTLSSGEASWSATIEPTSVVDLFQVEFQVEFSDPKEEQLARFSETLYLLRPTWSDPEERDQLLQDKRDELEDSRNF